MQRIRDQKPHDSRVTLEAIAWVGLVRRPLSFRELQQALTTDPWNKGLSDIPLEVFIGEFITQLCAGLVFVDQRNNVVELVHYSAKTYINAFGHIYFPKAQCRITKLCAAYLRLDILRDVKIWKIPGRFPLACYAAQYMGDHALDSPEDQLDPSISNVLSHVISHPPKTKPLLAFFDTLKLKYSDLHWTGYSFDRNADELAIQSAETEMPASSDAALELSEEHPSNTSSMTSTVKVASDRAIPDLGDEERWETFIKRSPVPRLTVLDLAALIGLAKYSSTFMYEALLYEGPDIEVVDETGKNKALALALERGLQNALELCINSCFWVDLCHDHGQAILLFANERDWHTVVDSILSGAHAMADEAGSGIEQHQVSLLMAAYDNDVKKVRQENQSLDLKSEHRTIGETSLFLSIERQHFTMTQELLDLSVDANATDSSGRTALHRATGRKHLSLIRLLINNGALVDCKDNNGRTPWSANVRSRATFTSKLLLEAGADPNTRGVQGVSELYTAAKAGETDIVKFMLESGTDPSIQTNYGWTPLHWAAFYGHIDCVQLLLRYGADVCAVSDQKVTPLDLALQAGQDAVVALLTARGGKKYTNLSLAVPFVPSVHLEEEAARMFVCTTRLSEREDASCTRSSEYRRPSKKPTKLRLVFDKPLVQTLKNSKAVGQFIYAADTSDQSGNTYEVSAPLETHVNPLSVRHSATRAKMWDYPLHPSFFDEDDILYDIVRILPTYDDFELRGRHQDHLPGKIKLYRDDRTGNWKIRRDDAPFIRTTPDFWPKDQVHADYHRWVSHKDGNALAKSGWEDETPNLAFEGGVDAKTRDVIVACWVAMLWAETVFAQIVE